MKALAQRRARITKVREIQHLQAAGAAASAEQKVIQLEGNAARLAALRTSLGAEPGLTSGAALGNAGELAQRLDQVRSGLADALAGARIVAERRADERLEADIARASAEKLEHRAVAELQAMIEQRMLAALRPRKPSTPQHG